MNFNYSVIPLLENFIELNTIKVLAFLCSLFPVGKGTLRRLGADYRIILKRTLLKLVWSVWAGLIWLRYGLVECSYKYRNENSSFIKVKNFLNMDSALWRYLLPSYRGYIVSVDTDGQS
jgi:hypothetical protein